MLEEVGDPSSATALILVLDGVVALVLVLGEAVGIILAAATLAMAQAVEEEGVPMVMSQHVRGQIFFITSPCWKIHGNSWNL